MKIYLGLRTRDGTCHVDVTTPDRRTPLRKRLDLLNHSPAGFEWGYGGSGPAQLALAILADTLEAPRARQGRRDWELDELDARTIAVRLHQEFKRNVIAGLPRDRQWTITEQAVREFVAEHQRQESHDVDLRQ